MYYKYENVKELGRGDELPLSGFKFILTIRGK